MSDPHVVTGLMAKRAELAGKIEHHRTIVRQLLDDLAAIDQALRLFKPGFDVEIIRPQRFRRDGAYQDKVAPVMLSALRQAGRPLLTRELTLHLMTVRRMDAANEALVRKVGDSVGACMRHLRAVGQVQSVKAEGGRLAWEIA